MRVMQEKVRGGEGDLMWADGDSWDGSEAEIKQAESQDNLQNIFTNLPFAFWQNQQGQLHKLRG